MFTPFLVLYYFNIGSAFGLFDFFDVLFIEIDARRLEEEAAAEYEEAEEEEEIVELNEEDIAEIEKADSGSDVEPAED